MTQTLMQTRFGKEMQYGRVQKKIKKVHENNPGIEEISIDIVSL